MNMKIKDVIAILVVFTSVIFTVIGRDSTTNWKELFRDNRKWTGYYQLYNRPYACNVYVHSVQEGDDGVAYVTFKSEGAVIDMNVMSSDDTIVTMKKSTSFNNTPHFPVDQDFQAVGMFHQERKWWKYVANITIPQGKGFQTLNLHSILTSGDTTDGDSRITQNDRSLSLGLAVGIPVTLAILLMIAGVGIGVWAVKKGYLRHVPRAYKNFRNQSEPHQVSFDKSEPTNVHI